MNFHISIPYMVETIAFLITVVVIVPLFKRLKLSPILGYLGVGALVGPYSLGLLADAESVRHFAELGVLFLLFAIGLELSFERLRAYSRLIFGLGSAQVLVSTLAIGGIAYAWGNSAQVAVVIGLCLALSSTAMVMQVLTERGEIASVHGRASFAILLLQDLAVVPILILLGVLGAGDGENLWLGVGISLLKAILAVGFILVVGRFALRYLFRIVAGTHSVDVFTAMILLSVLAIALLTEVAGLSMALGAFLAGLLLAETEFRHQIESEIMPFKGLLLGLFFMSVGMSLDFALVMDKAVWVLLSVLGLIGLKTLIGFILGRLFGLSNIHALRMALYVSEAGEFAFVIIGQATLSYGLIANEIGQFMVIVAGLSMTLTPGLALLAAILGRLLSNPDGRAQAHSDEVEGLAGHVIIAGYGRVGQAVAAVLKTETVPFVALDLSAERVRTVRQESGFLYYGDATRPEVLKAMGVEHASLVLVTLDDAAAAGSVVECARRLWPELQILVRARDLDHADQLHDLGADAVVIETLEASLQLSGQVLQHLGVPAETVNDCLENIREYDYQQIREGVK